MRKYCGEVFDRFLPFESILRLVSNYYANQNLYCKWRAINTDPSQNIKLNITRFSLNTADKYFIEINYYDGTSNTYDLTSKYFFVTSTSINFIVFHYYSPSKYSVLPFTASFQFADGTSITNNYFNIFIIIGLVILGCIILTIFLHRCSKFYSRGNSHNLSNNSSRINQPMAALPASQRIIQDFIEEREEYQNRMFLREEKKKQKNLAALDKLFQEEIKTEKFQDKIDKEFTNCTICLEDYIPDADVVTLTCKHTFHHTCMKDWLLRVLLHPKCPNCNYNILNLPEEDSSDSDSDSYIDSEYSDSHEENPRRRYNQNNNQNGRNNTYANSNRNNNAIRNNNSINNNNVINRTFSRPNNINGNNNGFNRSEVLIINHSDILNRSNVNINPNVINNNESRDVNNLRSNSNLLYIQQNRSGINNANNSSGMIRRGRDDLFNNITAISIDTRSLNNGENFVLNSNINGIPQGQENNVSRLYRHNTNNFVLNRDEIDEERL